MNLKRLLMVLAFSVAVVMQSQAASDSSGRLSPLTVARALVQNDKAEQMLCIFEQNCRSNVSKAHFIEAAVATLSIPASTSGCSFIPADYRAAIAVEFLIRALETGLITADFTEPRQQQTLLHIICNSASASFLEFFKQALNDHRTNFFHTRHLDIPNDGGVTPRQYIQARAGTPLEDLLASIDGGLSAAPGDEEPS
jgi:hypothetical protein